MICGVLTLVLGLIALKLIERQKPPLNLIEKLVEASTYSSGGSSSVETGFKLPAVSSPSDGQRAHI